MKHVWKKICPLCGTAFVTGLRYTKYCPEHRNAKKAGKGWGRCARGHAPGVCAQCGRPFHGHGNARFCGDACRERHSEAQGRQSRQRKPDAVAVRACHDCGRRTTDYRCPACREKFRQRHGVDEDCMEDFLYV